VNVFFRIYDIPAMTELIRIGLRASQLGHIPLLNISISEDIKVLPATRRTPHRISLKSKVPKALFAIDRGFVKTFFKRYSKAAAIVVCRIG
jgi:hypothetical protein